MTNNVPNHHLGLIRFLGSFPHVSMTPSVEFPEFAFMGRSNVGKSSLINYLCNRKKLAKTSGTPGKTQLINLFEIEHKWVLADLPGYGYARVSKSKRVQWSAMVRSYLRKREQLKTVFLLIDSRVPPQKPDLQELSWLGENHIPFSLIFTKIDQLKPKEAEANVALFLESVTSLFDQVPNHFVTSSVSRTGASDVLDYIDYVSQTN